MRPLGDPDALISTDDLGRQPRPSRGCCTLRLHDLSRAAGSRLGRSLQGGRGLQTLRRRAHPGADFPTCRVEFSATDTKLKFMMPPAEPMARAFGRHGLGDGARVVLYSVGTMMWATRFWWMTPRARLRRRGGARRWLRPVARRRAARSRRATPRATRRRPFTPPPRPGRSSTRPRCEGRDRRCPFGSPVNDAPVPSSTGAGALALRRPGPRAGLGQRAAAKPDRSRDQALRLAPPTPWPASPAPASTRIAASSRTAVGGTPPRPSTSSCCTSSASRDLTLYDGSMGEWAKDPSLPIETE